MPAAAVTPAPVAYIKVVAVKKLVVGFLVRRAHSASSLMWQWCTFPILRGERFSSLLSLRRDPDLLL